MKKNEQKKLELKSWVLLQHKSKYYIGIIIEISEYIIKIIGYRDKIESFKTSDITIVSYKPNINIIPINETIKNYPNTNCKITEIIETIKKQDNYDVILTNNAKFTKKINKTQINKTQKTTLWKKFYSWIFEPEIISCVTPIVFFKFEHLEFVVVVTKFGGIKFLDRNFEEIEEIKQFSNEKLNDLIKKFGKDSKEKTITKHQFESVFDKLGINNEFIKSLKRD
jgi:hypothetical protein